MFCLDSHTHRTHPLLLTTSFDPSITEATDNGFPMSHTTLDMEDEAFLAFLTGTCPSPVPPLTYASQPVGSSSDCATNMSSCLAPTTPLPAAPTNPTPVSRRPRKSNARIGRCQHPKHIIYRQHTAASTPRRGRPPKGTKATDQVDLPTLEMTVRPLPKRLQKAVGVENIRVCLTCLKRSDMDPEYIAMDAYVGPHAVGKRHK